MHTPQVNSKQQQLPISAAAAGANLGTPHIQEDTTDHLATYPQSRIACTPAQLVHSTEPHMLNFTHNFTV
jgi:hypothetical protein